jgi:flavorubredoxin
VRVACSAPRDRRGLLDRGTVINRAQREGVIVDGSYRVGTDVWVLPSHIDVPGAGTLLVNSFVLLSEQPVLIDCGLAIDGPAFVDAVTSIVDPADLEWIWLTHDDSDHTGNLPAIMQQAPNARLATHGLGALRMNTWWPVPLDRVHALALGDGIDVGDRTLRAVRPPTYDNPMSTGIFDESTTTLFSVDSFGAILPSAVHDLGELSEEELTGGMTAWAAFDSPWTHIVDRRHFTRVLDEVRALDPSRILPSHLPPATGRLVPFLDLLASIPDASPFAAPDATAFAQIAAALLDSTPPTR